MEGAEAVELHTVGFELVELGPKKLSSLGLSRRQNQQIRLPFNLHFLNKQ